MSVRRLLLAVLTAGVVLGWCGSAGAQEIKYKAVYRDAGFFTNWNSHEIAQVVADYFASQGYEVLDEPKLRPWLDARIQDREAAILINSHDTFPDSALDPVGEGLLPSPNNPIRRFLLAGGRILNYGDIPFYLHATENVRAEAGWAGGGGTVILGRSTNSGTWDRNDIPTITDTGKAWGLTQDFVSTRPNGEADVDIVLSRNGLGQPSAWVQKFTNVPGRGEFIRILDSNPGTVDRITPEILADMKRVAEYNEPGAVLTALDTGIQGVVKATNGQPLAASNVLVQNQDGRTFYAATDTLGHYFAYLMPGDYTVTVPGDYGQDKGLTPTTLTAGAVTTVDISLSAMPTMNLATEDLPAGVAWRIWRGGTLWDFTPADPAFKETTDWEDVDIPSDAQVQDLNGAYFWYRLKFQVPAEWAGYRRGLIVDSYSVEDSDWSFFNGHFIGNSKWNTTGARRYFIASDWVNFGGDNVLAVKGQHGNDTGGMNTKGPVLHLAKAGVGGVLVSVKQPGTGHPALSATVVLQDATGKERGKVVVREAGYAAFKEIPAGDYTVALQPGPAIANAAPITASVKVEAGKVAETSLVPEILPLMVAGDPSAYDDDFSGSTLKSKWTSVEIGDAGGSSAAVTDGHLVISAAGANIYDQTDNFHFVYQKVKGDFSATVKVLSVPYTQTLAKAGLMMRASEDPADVEAMLYQSPTEDQQYGVRFQYRPTRGTSTQGGAVNFDQPGVVAPSWLNLRRVGKTVTAYFSTDGSAASLVDTTTSVTINSLPDEVLLGLAWASRGDMGDAVFDDFAVRTIVPAPAILAGDVTEDGKFDIRDIIQTLRAVAGLAQLTPTQQQAGNVTRSGKLGITDVVLMLRKLAGLADFPQ